MENFTGVRVYFLEGSDWCVEKWTGGKCEGSEAGHKTKEAAERAAKEEGYYAMPTYSYNPNRSNER